MVTRTLGEDWIVLQSEDHGYNVKDGHVFRWADSFCSRMVQGLGPKIAPRPNEIPVYASAPIAAQVKIGAYVGIPLRGPDGSLFGTLCAIDPVNKPDSITEEQELVEVLGAMLGTLVHTEMRLADQVRRAEKAEAEALTDSLTGLFNRRGWGQLLAGEEERCRRHGHAASVFVIDLDSLKEVNDTRGHFAGDQLIARAASALKQVSRSQDIAARTGGDEFALLATECDREATDLVERRLRTALADAGVAASIGWGSRHPSRGLTDAWEIADRAMYAVKKSRGVRH
jgi:diguanylate cyclase (GGDEF)-like protein